jgi:uncharacterized protein (DUF488 family)
MKIFTIGYVGVKQSRFIEILKENGVLTLVDVRRSPASKNPAYNSIDLKVALRLKGIEYVSLTNLGLPYKLWHSENWKDGYREYVVENIELAKQQLQKLRGPIALMCKEKNHVNCHRSILASELSHHNHAIEHIDIEGKQDAGSHQLSDFF